jgi:hypothetical protein
MDEERMKDREKERDRSCSSNRSTGVKEGLMGVEKIKVIPLDCMFSYFLQ